MNKFNVGDKVRVNSEGKFLVNAVCPILDDVEWTIEEVLDGKAYIIKHGNQRLYIYVNQITKVEEESTMKIIRKSVASIEDRNEENNIICAHCGAIIGVINDDDFDDVVEFDGKYYCDEDCLNAETWVCDECGERFYKDSDEQTVTYNGDIICERCTEEEYFWCEDCGEWHHRYEENWCAEDCSSICNDCLNEERHHFRCSHCGEVHRVRDARTVFVNEEDNEQWCENCFNYYAYYCEECERYYSGRTVNVNEDGVCEFCRRRDQPCGDIEKWHAPRGVRNYGYKPDPCFCMTEEQKENCTLAQLICLGFELEMEDHRCDGYNVDEDADYLNDTLGYTYCKHDGSLTNGLELVSHPATIEYIMEHKSIFKEALDAMIDKGYTSHDNRNCGLHFHISLAPMLEKNEHSVANILAIVDTLWDKFVHFSRRTNRQLEEWAQRYNTKGIPHEELYKTAKQHSKHDRYMAVNLRNEHTVEIRMFRGTLKVDTFIATAQLVQRLVDVAIECKTIAEAYEVTWERLIDCDYIELTEYCKSRFSPEANEADCFESREAAHAALRHFGMSEEQMHVANIAVGDPIEIRGGAEYWNGRTGIVSQNNENSPYIHSEDILGVFGDPLNICNMHAIRTNSLRAGDYVRLSMSMNEYSESDDYNTDYYSFSRDLERGEVGIIRCEREGEENIWGVEFNRHFSGCHSCSGHVVSEHGQYIPGCCLELI